jgi:hypothetical protein
MMTDRDSIISFGNRIGITSDQVTNIAKIVLKGEENTMDPKILEMLSKIGVSIEEGKSLSMDDVSAIVLKQVETLKVASTQIADAFMTIGQVSEKLGKEMTADEVLSLAKEGQEYHKKVVEDALAMGVRAMGNDFPADTWKNTFSTMGTQAINDIMKTWETQAKDKIPAGRKTDAGAGFQQQNTAPDEAFVVGR